MSDPDFHGPPGVEYTSPEEGRGFVIVSQIPSASLIAASPELETLFYAEVLLTELRNDIARELQDATLPLGDLYREMRAIDFRAGDEQKAAYEEARDAVRAERTRLIGRGGTMRVLAAEKRDAELDRRVAMAERLDLQREVRIALRDARMAR